MIKQSEEANNTSKITKPKRPQVEKKRATQLKTADLSKTSVEKKEIKPIKVNEKVVV